MQKAPHLQDVSSLRGFLGLVNYYHRFLPNLASVLHPLKQLLDKDQKWMWSKECEQAFGEAESLITSKQVLVHYDPNLPIRVACDAPAYGLGAVLTIRSIGETNRVRLANFKQG